MEAVIVILLLVGYTVLSVWGYRVAGEQARKDAVQGRQGANPSAAHKS